MLKEFVDNTHLFIGKERSDVLAEKIRARIFDILKLRGKDVIIEDAIAVSFIRAK